MMVLQLALLSLAVFCFHAATCIPEQSCDPSSLPNGCAQYESCNDNTKQCECSRGYVRKGKGCVLENINGRGNDTPSSSSLTGEGGPGHIVAAVLIPIFIVSTLLVAAYVGQKYKVFSWLRNWLGRKTKYDEFMIGQEVEDDDDPPLH